MKLPNHHDHLTFMFKWNQYTHDIIYIGCVNVNTCSEDYQRRCVKIQGLI